MKWTAYWYAGLAWGGLYLAGCRDRIEEDSGGRDSSVVVDDTGEPSIPDGLRESLGCLDGSGPFSSVESTETLVAMVPRIGWTSTEELEVRAVTDIGRDEPRIGALHAPASEGDVLVLGIPALTEAAVVLTAETDAGLVCSQEIPIAAASLPPNLPAITLSSHDPDLASGGFISTVVITESGRYVVVLDELGEYVWVLEVGYNSVAGADFTEDGEGLVYMRWAEEADPDTDPPVPAQAGRVVWLGWDGEPRFSVEVEETHTDFTELPDGSVVSLIRTYRELSSPDGSQELVKGDGLVQVTRDGEITQVWDVFDTLQPELEPAMDALKSFSHANSVSYHEASDDFLVGLANFNSILRIDHGTGALVWDLANDDAALVASAADDEEVIVAPHSAELIAEDTLLLFNRNYDDSGETPVTDMCSEAIFLELDPASGQATELSAYGSDNCVLVVFFGEAIHMDNGNTRVIFSSSGQMSEGTPAGETVWQVNTALGGAFGFGDWVGELP